MIKLLLADVDGTLVTHEKVLTDRAIAAVHQLYEAGVKFALTSGRPPKGMEMLVEPLAITTPISAFNGGSVVKPDMSVITQKAIPGELVQDIIARIGKSIDVWVYRGAEWLIRDIDAPHVARERSTVQFDPTVVDGFAGITDGVAKIVGVSDDLELVKTVAAEVHDAFGDHVASARSQPYYVDVTHPQANKGAVAQYLAEQLGITTDEIATIGDMANDVLMFAHSGLSIAMGQADDEVKRAARRITESNADDGFALAVERFVLPAARN